MTLTSWIKRSYKEPLGNCAGGTGRAMSSVIGVLLTLVIFLSTAVPGVAEVLPGTSIDNTASVQYSLSPGGPTRAVTSNTQSDVVVPLPTPATVKFMRYQPGSARTSPFQVGITRYSTTGQEDGAFDDLPTPVTYPGNTPINLSEPVDLLNTGIYLSGDPLFLILTDLDQNLRYDQTETVTVTVISSTGDTEVLTLKELTPNAGVFIGYIQSSRLSGSDGNGMLFVEQDGTIKLSYVDNKDPTDLTSANALFDPMGVIFDSQTGELVDDVAVTIVDAVTGQPAVVYGDDGISRFPSTVTTGGTATDSSGTVYSFPTGCYRFPLMNSGTYRLDVTPVDGYGAPSEVPDNVLQRLPGAPWALDEDGSRGRSFTLPPLPIFKVDIPIDPVASSIWAEKSAVKQEAAIGDFVPYQIKVSNNSPRGRVANVQLQDYLPRGFRYIQGSATLNEQSIIPTVSPEGRTLTFTLGEISSGQTMNIAYVTEVTAGTPTGKATNSAVATTGSGLRSNVSRASVTIKDVFMRHASLLAGRVVTGSCEEAEQNLQGVEGIRIYLEDGTFVVTDEQGRYHIEGVEPGTHVVQLDQESYQDKYKVEVCEPTTQFAGVSWSQFVDIQPGTLWRANFHLRELHPAEQDKAGALSTGTSQGSLELALRTKLVDEQLTTIELPVKVKHNSAENVRLSVILPPGSEYVAGSSTLNGAAAADPNQMAVVLNYRLGDIPANTEQLLQLKVRLPESIKGDVIPFRALATIDTSAQKNLRTQPITSILKRHTGKFLKLPEITLRPEFPSFGAELSREDRQKFNDMAIQLQGMLIEQIVLTGHTDNQPIAKRSQHIFADNHALSIGRAESVADYLCSILEMPKEKILISGAGDSSPLASNTTSAGRARNRRVEMRLVALKPTQTSTEETTEAQAAPLTFSSNEASANDAPAAEITDKELREAIFAEDYIDEITDGYGWLWPSATHYPPIPSIKVAVKHDPQHKVRFVINGQAANPLNYEGSKQNKERSVSLSQWNGVDLIDGDNHLRIEILDSSGTIVHEENRNIHYSLSPVEAILIEEESTLVADTRTPAIIAVRLLDREGHPAREEIIGEFRINPPYRADKQHLHDNKFTEQDDKARFQVGENGIARIAIAPTSQTGEVEVVLNLADGAETIKVWLKPAPRDWILVGFAEGTVGYNTFSGNEVSLEEAGIDEHYYDDGQVKFFAKGAIKGDWLLTMAYDSDKPNRDGDSLYQIIDPDTYYPLYGDGTNQGYEASSAHDIYIKLERNQFYALFGDMNTGLSQTELSRYNRSMSGFKSEMQTYNFSYTMFAADTKQAFIKDEIRGDGTSGRYYLTQKELVINSEEVTLETRDRFRSEVIIETQTLQRHTDYDIDYDNGSLFFKRPVASKDDKFNPIFIVVRYETFDSKDENFNYGGRAAVKVLDQKIEVGASYVHEERGSGKGDLYGTDATIKLTPQTTLHLEAARTENEFFDENETDNAYLAEISHEANRIKTRAYYKEQGKHFGLGQQNISESGTRKYGAEALYHFTPKFSLAGLAYHEDVLASGNKRDVGELDARYQAERFGLHSGFRHAEDRLDGGSTMRSEQILAGGNGTSANTKLNLRADHEQPLSGRNKNVDYPPRTILGLDYQVNQWVRAFAEQEFTWGKEEDTEGTRVGFNATPWQGGDVHTTIERQMTENSQRVFAIFGLGQNWRINESWSIDATLDRSYTVKSNQDYQFNENVPTAQGSADDFTAVSVGSTYRKAKWTWWNRLETRQADSADKYGISTSIVAEPQDGIAFSAKALAFISDVSNGVRRTDGNIRMGMAYRPAASRWIILNRLDFYFDKEDHSTTEYDNWRIVNNIHANFRLNRKLQMSFYYGLKYVRDNYDGRTYSGYTDLIAFESRYNINKRWDVGVHGSILHSWNSNSLEYSAGADVGYSPVTNTWVSLGYNIVGFEDEDFSSASYTAQGAYMRFRAKFDQHSVRDAAAWINQ